MEFNEGGCSPPSLAILFNVEKCIGQEASAALRRTLRQAQEIVKPCSICSCLHIFIPPDAYCNLKKDRRQRCTQYSRKPYIKAMKTAFYC